MMPSDMLEEDYTAGEIAAMEASRQRSTALFVEATYQMIRYFGVPTTAFHQILAEDYGRQFLRISDWSGR